MPEFWQFPTVSMGPADPGDLPGALSQACSAGFANTENRKVWVFCGDGEMDERVAGAIGMAVRENLDNLIFVINCNLQRLDGPVRGNGKIIQERKAISRRRLERDQADLGFLLGPLLARDKEGILRRIMEETVDGEYQNFKANDGEFVRKHFFGNTLLLEMVSRMTDEDIWRLNRGGHDPHKTYAAYAAAVKHKGQPTVILAKTIRDSASAARVRRRTRRIS